MARGAGKKRAASEAIRERIAKLYRQPELRAAFAEWGRRGGERRKAVLSAEQRSAIAKNAVAARERKKRRQTP